MKCKKTLMLKVGVLFSYLGMIVVNFLAVALPIAGKTTGELSDAYPNLFTPAGITFSIWGLIYLLLGVYVVYYLIKKDEVNKGVFDKVAKLFILSSVANMAWIFAWHYEVVSLSVLIMLVMLVSLIMIAGIINKEKLSTKEEFCLRLPFSVYFGWITVATIANITAFLVRLSWNGFGLAESIWTIIILLVGAAIGILRAVKDKNVYYILVFVWAYYGIYTKHISEAGFSRQYPSVINTTLVAIALFLSSIIFITYKKKK